MSSSSVISSFRTKIYALKENGFVRYVGKTSRTLERRLSDHLNHARKGGTCHKTCWLRKVLVQGVIPSIVLIEEVEGNGNKEEIAWIKYFRDAGVRLTNLTDGGDGGAMPSEIAKKTGLLNKGRHHSLETRQIMSAVRKGHLTSAETRQKISEAQKGCKRSQVAIGKNRTSHTGKKATDETKRKMSLVHMNHPVTEQTKQKISAFFKGRLGRKKTEEEKKKISQAMILVRQNQRQGVV